MNLKANYDKAKKLCPGQIALFRMGDFYEAHYDDATIIAKQLGLTLITRGKRGTDEATPMAGFPHHQLDGYLKKLVGNGHRVAVFEPASKPVTYPAIIVGK